jgi:hypothetical protein
MSLGTLGIDWGGNQNEARIRGKLGECSLLCKQDVIGSNPFRSTIKNPCKWLETSRFWS